MTARLFTSGKFWKAVPTGSLVIFLAAVFCTFSSLAFLIDIGALGTLPAPRLWWSVGAMGGIAVLIALAAIRKPALIPLVVLLHIGLSEFVEVYFRYPPSGPIPATDLATVQSRVAADAAGSVIGIMLGYGLFLFFISREGGRHFRLQSEVGLAREIHSSLVPPVSVRGERYEIHGRSIAASEVGGDLLDVVETRDGPLCYVADVSGHGVPAGALMGMFKSAARMRLRAGSDLGPWLDDLNEIVLQVRGPNMFVTCAALRLAPDLTVEYALAGHPPILHYRSRSRQVERLMADNLPLGVLAGQSFWSGQAAVERGDLLAIITDGLTEVFNSRREQLGLEPLETLLLEQAEAPLEKIFDAMIATVRHHGKQVDDQTLALVRVR